MNPLPSSLILCALMCGISPISAAQTDPPSLVSEIIASYTPAFPASDGAQRATAAKAFLDVLNEDLKAQAMLPLDSPERAKWTNTPPRGEQGGVRLGALDKAQLEKACDFLATALSKNGYDQAISILLADDELLPPGGSRPGFGAENYWLAIFGEPDAKKPWAIQFDGHHLAINATYAGDKACFSPSFIGTQPAKVDFRGKDTEVMGGEVHMAFKLVGSFDKSQRSAALLGGKRGRIFAGANRDGKVPEQVGVSCSTFTAEQREQLVELLEEWVGDLPADAAAPRMEQLKSEIDKMSFAWRGPTDPGSDVSYRIQGPTLLVEYACQDLGGDPLNHLHSIYRDPTNEYGKQLISGN